MCDLVQSVLFKQNNYLHSKQRICAIATYKKSHKIIARQPRIRKPFVHNGYGLIKATSQISHAKLLENDDVFIEYARRPTVRQRQCGCRFSDVYMLCCRHFIYAYPCEYVQKAIGCVCLSFY